jgi:2-methylcitrate dehydratase PrpD
MDETATPSRRLAEWCASLRWNQVPAEVRAVLPLRLLDTTGLILAGARTPAGEAALAFTRNNAGAPKSTVATHGERVPPSAAALFHGIAAHCRDFDDTFMDSLVHPGSVVIPTALAVAEAEASMDEDFAVAITVGYEVAARIGAVAGRRFHARSLHPTGIVGPLAAAVTAARLLGLSGEQTSWAMGLAASMSGGLRAFAVDGGWSKWLHAGWAAHGGIVAAELASQGYRGPEHVLEGEYDLYSALLHGEAPDRSGLTHKLGHSWQGIGAAFKYYPCAHVIHPYIDAVLAVVRQYDLKPDDIADIECAIAPSAAAIVCEPRADKLRPATVLGAIGSLPYQLAAAVVERRVGLSALEPGTREREDIRDVAKRIRHREDAALGGETDGEICVRTNDGTRHVQRAGIAGVDRGRLRDKFVDLAGPLLGADEAGEAAQRLLDADGPTWRWATELFPEKPESKGKELK